MKRFGILGAQDDIANAIDALAGAVGRTPVDDPARAARISNLSTSLSELARATQSLKVAEDAIESGGSRSS